MRTEVIVVVAPRFDGLARLGETEEHVLIEAYMDPASAQGYFSMLRIGCSHISGLLLGLHFGTPGPDGIRALSPRHSCGLMGLPQLRFGKCRSDRFAIIAETACAIWGW